jgi:hypothetical protein
MGEQESAFSGGALDGDKFQVGFENCHNKSLRMDGGSSVWVARLFCPQSLPVQPKGKEAVLDVIESVLVLEDQHFFAQGFECGVDAAWRREFVFFDKGGLLRLRDLGLGGYRFQEAQLAFGDDFAVGFIGGGFAVEYLPDEVVNVRRFVFRLGQGEELVAHKLDIPCVAEEQVVDAIKDRRPEVFSLSGEQAGGKGVVAFQRDFSEGDFLRALVKGASRRREHGVHQVFFAAGENEFHVWQELQVGAQEGLDAFFRVFCYLLEFINRNVAPFSRVPEVIKNGLLI